MTEQHTPSKINVLEQSYTCNNCGTIVSSSVFNSKVVKCTKCSGICKEGINITGMLKRIYELEDTLRQHGIYAD